MITLKPFPVRLLKALIFVKLIFAPVIILMYLLTAGVEPGEKSFGGGIRGALNDRLGLSYGFSSYEFGYLMGSIFIPLVISALMLMFVVKRKFVWVVVFASLELLVGFASGFPILSIIILVMVLTNPTRDYLKGKDNNAPPPAMPLDYEFKDS